MVRALAKWWQILSKEPPVCQRETAVQPPSAGLRPRHRGQPAGARSVSAQNHRHRPDREGAQEEATDSVPSSVVDGPSRIGAEAHPDARDEEDPAVGRAQDALAEVLPGHDRVQRHGAPVGDPEGEGEAPERALAAWRRGRARSARLQAQRRSAGCAWRRPDRPRSRCRRGRRSTSGPTPRGSPAAAILAHALVDGVGDQMEERPRMRRAAAEVRERDGPERPGSPGRPTPEARSGTEPATVVRHWGSAGAISGPPHWRA